MSTSYLISLVAVVAFVAILRLVAPQPSAVASRRGALPAADLTLLVIGLVLLALHCGSMFFRDATTDLGLGGYASFVDRFGPASMVLYSVPAAAVVFALRRLTPIALVIVAAALVAVGVTMYDGGSLAAHLTAIFATIVCLAVAVLFGTRPALRVDTT